MTTRARRWAVASAAVLAVLAFAVGATSLYAGSESGADRCHHALVVEAHLDEVVANRVEVETRGWSWVPLGIRCAALIEGRAVERVVAPW